MQFIQIGWIYLKRKREKITVVSANQINGTVCIFREKKVETQFAYNKIELRFLVDVKMMVLPNKWTFSVYFSLKKSEEKLKWTHFFLLQLILKSNESSHKNYFS